MLNRYHQICRTYTHQIQTYRNHLEECLFTSLQTIILVLFLTQNKPVEVTVMKKGNYSKKEPTLAEGINTEDILNQDASQEEIENGESTNVTILTLDENDPS
jgi:hypothetical protein